MGGWDLDSSGEFAKPGIIEPKSSQPAPTNWWNRNCLLQFTYWELLLVLLTSVLLVRLIRLVVAWCLLTAPARLDGGYNAQHPLPEIVHVSGEKDFATNPPKTGTQPKKMYYRLEGDHYVLVETTYYVENGYIVAWSEKELSSVRIK